jgi:hypothetical protein
MAAVVGFSGALGVGVACGDPAGSDCLTGSASCSCTAGGGCDPNLSCINGTCVAVGDATGDGGPGDGGPGTSADGPGQTSGTSAVDSSDGGIKLDVGIAADIPVGNCAETGCKKIDLLFAIDSTLSMIEEINALTGAFAQIVAATDQLNCGGIEYRIGLTNDNDGGFIGYMGTPWFDSSMMTAQEITTAFNGAAGTILGNGGTALGCEHVLSSSVSTLALDTTGFLRPEALLVLVLVTDVDDYGDYDHMGFGGPCDGMLCTEPVQAIPDIFNNLVTLKGGDPTAVAAIVAAGDPTNTEGMNLCQQPASCCGAGFECSQALHGTRLYEFASMLPGTNGVTVDICAGAEQLPSAIEMALGGDIDLACQTYEPEG